MFSLHFSDLMANDMKKAITNCIPCMKLKVPTDPDGIENKSGQNIKKSQENALMEKENRRQRQMHTVPSSLIEVTKGQNEFMRSSFLPKCQPKV